MTATDTTRAMFRAVWGRPEDDTVRLVYADALDDAAGRVRIPCPRCVNEHCLDGDSRCGACGGMGRVEVSDTNAERAEFIRVQVECWRINPAVHAERCNCKGCKLRRRERKLLAAHGREWARVPWNGVDAFDLHPFYRAGQPANPGQAVPHWHRGFVYRVDVPALSWLFERVQCPKCGADQHDDRAENCTYCDHAGLTLGEWRVPPWALAVAAAHPVTEWRIGGLEPRNVTAGTSGITAWYWEPDDIPPGVFDRLKAACWNTEAEALLALAQAAGAWVRDAVRGMWTKEEEANA